MPNTITLKKGHNKKIDYLPAIFLLAAFLCFPKGAESESLNSLAIIFVSIVLEAIPFMLVGSLVGGIIEAFVSRERLVTALPRKGWLTVCVAAGAGMVFPVCECAVVPVVRRLMGKGLPFSAAIAYLLGGPIVNPIVAASTALAYGFDWVIVGLRLSLGYGIAVAIGMLMGRLFNRTGAVKETALKENSVSCSCHHHLMEHLHNGQCLDTAPHFSMGSDEDSVSSACGCGVTGSPPVGWLNKAGAAVTHALDDFLAVGHYLVIGAFIAALAQTYVDRSSFLGFSGAPVISVALMMALAISLNLCSEADAFIAASLRGLMPFSAQMAFMLTGPMLDLKLLLMYQGVFHRRAIVGLAALILAGVFVVALGLALLNGMIQ